jgi:uncharacterized lipoprotein YddW (UPF0748 family)
LGVFLTGILWHAPVTLSVRLQFAIDEAHKRGLELHAWFNPYRARHPAGKSEISPDHLSRTKPELVKQYGKFMWMDPGEKGTQDHSLAVMLDVVRRYDIDGVHIDDYFYPYKEKDAAGNNMPFPDEPSWQKYVRSGGRLSRDDWRRQNVDQFIERLYREIKKEKRWVKFGISPFGIWRPGHPAQIQGFDQYAELYADARKWLVEGWVDYFTPQLYWPIDRRAQSYPVLLKWWAEQNPKGRHLWPGNYTGRVGDGTPNQFPVREVLDQIRVTREQPGATGNIHFSMKVFMQNRGGLNEQLTAATYAEPALVPASTWLDKDAPAKPEVRIGKENAAWKLSWEPDGKEKVWQWVLQTRTNGRWLTQVIPGEQTSWVLLSSGAPIERVALSAVDRNGNQSRPAELTPKE